MVCVFCGVTNCPMTSLLLSLELFAGNSLGMFTGQSLGLFAVCIAVAYMLCGYYGLYSCLLYTSILLEMEVSKPVV